MTENKQLTEVIELLKPRYKVIADWPLNTAFKVGEICDRNWEFEIGKLKTSLEDYPHLFKRLEWWEERKEEELPEYIHFMGTIQPKKNYLMFGYHKMMGATPATEEEYLSFINQNKNL